MSPGQILILSVGLSMDAFAVAIAIGIALKRPRIRQALTVGLFFGAFQAGMPLAGWLAGAALGPLIQSVDHWVAFVLLSFIGGKMFLEGMRPGPDSAAESSLALGTLAALSVATSIDALAAGVSLAFIGSSILLPAAVIGCVTFILSSLGVQLGSRLGHRIERYAHLAGGVLLIGIGIRVLTEHLAG